MPCFSVQTCQRKSQLCLALMGSDQSVVLRLAYSVVQEPKHLVHHCRVAQSTHSPPSNAVSCTAESRTATHAEPRQHLDECADAAGFAHSGLASEALVRHVLQTPDGYVQRNLQREQLLVRCASGMSGRYGVPSGQ